MHRQSHNKDAAREQGHQATADALIDKSAEHDRLKRGPVARMEHTADLRMRAKEMLQDALGTLSRERDEALSRIERAQRVESRAGVDSFELAGPGGAATRMRDELRRSQQEALEQSQANEWGRHFDRARESVLEAVRSVVFAAESMLARHEATESTLRDELAAKMDAARDRDQPAGNMTASDVSARQQRREEVVAVELETLAKRQLDEVGRLHSLVSDTREAIRSFTQDAQANAAESAGRSNAQQLQDAQERLQQFNEERRDVVALRIVWDGRLSDVEAMKRTWDKAAKGPNEELERKWDKLDEEGRREAAAKAYETAREKFWGLVNKQADDDAREVRRLLDRVGVEWREGGNNAPLLDGITVTLDHVADKAAHPELALDASNLRFLTNDDNSARGNHYSVTDRRNIDLVRSEEQQDRNAESRDRAAGKRFDRAHDAYEAGVVAGAQQRLKQVQDRAAAEHQEDLSTAGANHDKKADELRASKLRMLNGEDEKLHRERQDKRLEDLDRFLNAAREQIEQLRRFELSMHGRQQQELSQEQKRPAGEHLTAREVWERVQSLERRFAVERSDFDALWGKMDAKRNADERQMMAAIYNATSREAREEDVKRAFERQQRTLQEQERRLEEMKRYAHD